MALVPLLTAVPIIDIPTDLIPRQTVSLLNLSFELFATTIDNVQIIVSELSPLLFDTTFNLSPISFHSIPVHVKPPTISPRSMAGGEHMGLAMVPRCGNTDL
jgi:hypothetical protein